jgi:cold shock CspA family protein
MHGDRSQAQRASALAAFSAGEVDALVATDVVARGIHIDDVPCVVHFDPPEDATSYVHRSGRTGRTGRSGKVVTLVPDDVQRDVKELQRALGLTHAMTFPFGGGGEESARAGEAPAATRGPAPQAQPRLVTRQVTAVAAVPAPRTQPRPATRSATRRAPAHAESVETDRLQGVVKFFDGRGGYGFLAGPDGREIFVHHSSVTGTENRHRALRKGQSVSFAVRPGRRGSEAHDVIVRREGAA